MCVHTSGRLRLDLDWDWPGIGLWVAFTPDCPGSPLPANIRLKINFSRATLFQFLFYWCTLLSTCTVDDYLSMATSPFPVRSQSDCVHIYSWVRSEFSPSPPRLGGLKSCPNWVQIQSACVHARRLAIQIQSKSSPSPLVWTHLKRGQIERIEKKELVDMKVCNLIDGLPFTEDGYDKVKYLLVISVMEIQVKWLAPMYGIFSRCLLWKREMWKRFTNFMKHCCLTLKSYEHYKVLTNLTQRWDFTRHATSDKERTGDD